MVAEVIRKQKDFAKRIGDACAKYDIPYLFELLVYPLSGEANQTKDYVEMTAKHADHVLESVRAFAGPEYGIDIFKLESPVPAKSVPGSTGEGAAEVQKLFDEMGHLAGRPWGKVCDAYGGIKGGQTWPPHPRSSICVT